MRSGKGKRQVAQEEARVARLREQQMGFGTALPGSLPSLLQELLQLQLLPPLLPVVLCDIGAGCGNILSDVQDSEVLLPLSLPPPLPRTSTAPPPPPPPRLWGVEMNLAFTRCVRSTGLYRPPHTAHHWHCVLLCSGLVCADVYCAAELLSC